MPAGTFPHVLVSCAPPPRVLQVVVADTCFHSTLPRRRKPSQMDTVQPILHDPPAKLGFKISQAPKAPYSIFLGELGSCFVQASFKQGHILRRAFLSCR